MGSIADAGPLSFLPGMPEVIASREGTTLLWRPASAVVVMRVIGVLRVTGAAALETTVLRVTSELARCDAFCDWEEMTDYESEARVRLTASAQRGRTRKHLTSIHFLTRSTVVAIGVRTANLMLGGHATVHTKRGPFDDALKLALRR